MEPWEQLLQPARGRNFLAGQALRPGVNRMLAIPGAIFGQQIRTAANDHLGQSVRALMKIDPTKIRPATTRRVGGPHPSGNTDFAAALHEEAAAGGAHGTVGGAVGLGGVSTVLALQGTPDSTERRARRKAVERGDAMLDTLEELRLGLLLGTIPLSRLEQLGQLVRVRREQVNDPKLTAILDEIELRAAVELAKLSRPIP